jgi:hypothetical protein
VPNVHPVVSEIIASDDQVDAANNTCEGIEEFFVEADGVNSAQTDARRGVPIDVQADMHGADPDLDPPASSLCVG